jgi:cytoskeletal protein CcmA (bactofilin family)
VKTFVDFSPRTAKFVPADLLQSILGGNSMAWKWPGTSKNGVSEEWTGFIDQGVSLEGTLTVSGTFRIDGHIKGNIISEQTVILGENAKVEGQIEGNRVVIAGRFDGVIFAKGRVEIEPKGVVTGEVHAPCMVIDPGGIFDGRCHMLASSEAAAGVTIPIRAMGSA